MPKSVVLIPLAIALAVLLSAPPALAENCPWTISGIEAGRWGNGNLKGALWAHGSFPGLGGQKPVWFVNGKQVGHSTAFFKTQRIFPGVRHLKDRGRNQVSLTLGQGPHAGCKSSYSFTFDSRRIKPGQQVRF